jgi:hypothetical protein
MQFWMEWHAKKRIIFIGLGGKWVQLGADYKDAAFPVNKIGAERHR